MLVNHFPIDAIDCEQSLIFLLSHSRLSFVWGERLCCKERRLKPKQRKNLHIFTFSLTARGSEEKKTTAHDL